MCICEAVELLLTTLTLGNGSQVNGRVGQSSSLNRNRAFTEYDVPQRFKGGKTMGSCLEQVQDMYGGCKAGIIAPFWSKISCNSRNLDHSIGILTVGTLNE